MLDESSNLPKQLDFFEELGMDQSTINQLRAEDNIVSNSNEKVEISSNNKHKKTPQTKKWNDDGSYTEYNYSERANAEELVDFVSDFKEAVVGNNEQEPQDVIISKLKEEAKKKKGLKISRFFCNPITGGVMLVNGLALCTSIFLLPEQALTFCTIGLILIILGIISIVFGIRNVKFIARNAKQVYNVVNEREEEAEHKGVGKNRVTMIKEILVSGVITVVLWLVTIFSDGDVFDRIEFGVFSCVATFSTWVFIQCFIQEVKKRNK